MADIETLQELRTSLKLFAKGRDQIQHKKLIGDPGTSELAVADGDFVKIQDINTGAISNSTEYERRLSRFLARMLDISQAQSIYLDEILGEWTRNRRISGYTDQQYYEFVLTKLTALKETPLAIIALLQPFSSQPVLILECGTYYNTMYFDSSFAGYYEVNTVVDPSGDQITPAVLSMGSDYGDCIYYFRAKLQPISEQDERIIADLLNISHVSGVRYEIEYYSNPSWHPPLP